MTHGSPILFCDLDGTVRHGRDELGHFVNTADDVVVFPEAVELISQWRRQGGIAVGITNQGGVALGHITQREHEHITVATGQASGLDHIFTCTHVPNGGCWCRKPMVGLIYQAVEWVASLDGLYPLRHACLMVGDRDEDYRAAEQAGVPFEWASEWRAQA